MSDPANPYAAPAQPIDPPTAGTSIGPYVSVADTLRSAWGLYVENLITIIGVALLVWVPEEILRRALDPMGRIFWLWFALAYLSKAFVTGALVRAVDHRLREGTELSIPAALRAGAAVWMDLLAVEFRAWIDIVLGCALIFPGVLFAIRYSLVAPVAVLEVGRSPRHALEKSETLVEGHGGRVITVRLLALLLGGMATWPLWVASWFQGDSHSLDTAADALGRVTQCFSTIAVLTLYLNLRQSQWAASGAPGLRD